MYIENMGWEGELNQIYSRYLQTKITLEVQLNCGKTVGCIKLGKTIRMIFFDCVLPFRMMSYTPGVLISP